MDNKDMASLDTLRGEKRAAILKAAERHGVCNIRVFGSVARGDNRDDSDIDLLVDLERGRTLFDLTGFLSDVQDLLASKVDVVTTKGLHYLRERIMAEATPL